MDCKRNFKYTLRTKMEMPDLKPYSDLKYGRCRFSDSKSVYFCEFLHCFWKVRNPQVTFAEKPQMKINSLKKQLTLISNSYLIRHSFQWYRCKSGIAIFAWRVTRCTFEHPSWANLCSPTLDCTSNLQFLKRQRSVVNAIRYSPCF